MNACFRHFLLAGLAAFSMTLQAAAADSRDPKQSVGRANDAARVQPERATFLNAIQKYAWAEGALFQVYAKPGQVTDIVLQEGEELVGPGPVAAGDTVRWIIGDTVSGSGAARRVHILVKPTRPDIMTNIVINTSRRTYHIELRATPATYMASVSWSYPQDEPSISPIVCRATRSCGGRSGSSTMAGSSSSNSALRSRPPRCRRSSSLAKRVRRNSLTTASRDVS
jgi:type IV secretion system protein VirB9